MTQAGHIWRPYVQMKTAPPPLPVVATEGVRLKLADGRVLIDGISSWWTACHGYNHPAIRQAVERQLAIMPHVMFGGLTHDSAQRLAARLAELLPGDLDHVFFTESGSVAVEVRDEDGSAVLAEPRRNRAQPLPVVPRRLSRRHARRHVGLRSRTGHA